MRPVAVEPVNAYGLNTGSTPPAWTGADLDPHDVGNPR